MNLKTYDKGTRLLKQADLAATGCTLQGNTNVLMLGIIDCTTNSNDAIIQNLAQSIRQENGIALNFTITNFNYLQRLSPATAKYTSNYIDSIAKQTEAIVRTQMLDGIIAVIDNYVTGLGILTGCTRSNCPVLLMPTGINPHYDTSILTASGKIATREIKGSDTNQIINQYVRPEGIAPTDTLTLSFCKMAEAFDLMLPGATKLVANSGAILEFATNTGSTALQRADDIITTKRLISKRTLNENFAKYQENGGDVNGLLLFQKLFEMLELKLPTTMYPSLKTTLADQALVVANNTAPLTMSGKAWVYQGLTDAMTALCSNAIDAGIIVLQYCHHYDVSIIAHTIVAMQKQNEIALLTDGFCAATPALTVTRMLPDAFANQDFANIQNGDTIEIDVTKGRINISASAKDMKLRAKRNLVKKYEVFF